MGMVMAVHGRPPEGTALDREKAKQGKKELDGSAGLEGFVTKIPVVNPRDKKHPDHVKEGADEQRHRTPTHPKDPQASQVQDDEWERAAPFHLFGQGPGGLNTAREVIGIDETDHS